MQACRRARVQACMDDEWMKGGMECQNMRGEYQETPINPGSLYWQNPSTTHHTKKQLVGLLLVCIGLLSPLVLALLRLGFSHRDP